MPPSISIAHEISENLKKQSGAPYIYKISQGDLTRFVKDSKKQREEGSLVSFADYIKTTTLKNEYPNVIPDFSRIPLILPETPPADNVLDLSNTDFSGCSVSNLTFYRCNLSQSIFRDLDLSDVTFSKCKMQETDLRGAELGSCNITSPEEDPAPIENYRGLKIGSSPEAIKGYLGSPTLRTQKELSELKDQLQKTSNDIRTLEAFIKEDKEANYPGMASYLWTSFIGRKSDEIQSHEAEIARFQRVLEEQRAAENELKQEFERMDQTQKIDKTLPIHPSILTIAEKIHFGTKELEDESLIPMLAEIEEIKIGTQLSPKATLEFDPAYVRGTGGTAQKTNYISLTKGDIEVYRNLTAAKPDLSIGKFARDLTRKGAEHHPEDAQIIADFSGQNLSGFDFSGLDLRGACFSGADLHGAKFNGANISGVSFEGANLTGAEFKETTARDANLRAAEIAGAQIKHSDFTRADMSYSKASDIHIENSNLNFATISSSNWQTAEINDSSLNYTDFEDTDITKGTIERSSMQYSNFNSATLQECKIINSDLSLSTMLKTKANQTKFLEGTVLSGIDGKEIDLTDSKIDKSCKAKKIDLSGGTLDRLDATGVDFTGSALQKIQAKEAVFKEATLTNVPMQLSDLEGANFNSAQAAGLDITASYVSGMNANDTNLRGASLQGITSCSSIQEYYQKKLRGETTTFPTDITTQEKKIDLSRAILIGANLTSAIIPEADFDRADLRRSDLRGAKLRSSNFNNSKIERATTNTATNLQDSSTESTEGQLQHTDENNSTQRLAIQDKITKDNRLAAAGQQQLTDELLAGLDYLLDSSGQLIERAGDWMGYKVSPQQGRVIGAIAGAVVAIGIIGGTGGIAAVPLGLGVAVAAAGGAICGGLLGDQAVRHVGAISLGVGAAATAFYGTTVGGVAFTAAASVDQGIRSLTGGMGISGIIGRQLSRLGRWTRGLSSQQSESQARLNARNVREQEDRAHNRDLENSLQGMGQETTLDQSKNNKIYREQLSHSSLAEVKTPTKHIQDTKSIGYQLRQTFVGKPSVAKSNRAPSPSKKANAPKQRQLQRSK